jgi:hypothetical protein
LKRLVISAAALALLLPSTVRAQAPAPPRIEAVPADIQQLLDDYGRAWVKKDAKLLAGTLSPRLIKKETSALDAANEIDFSTFRLRVSTQYSGNLAYKRIRALYPHAEVRTHHVVVETAIMNESKAYSEDGAFTFAKEPGTTSAYGGWRLISKNDLDVLGFFSPHSLWDEGPVAVATSPHFILLTHPQVIDQVRPWLPIAEQAYARASGFWPGSIEKRIVIEVPASTQELARIMHDTADLDKFVAFVAASTSRERGWAPTGPRMFVHITHLLRYPGKTQLGILAHELIHALTRESSGPDVPTWIEEGIAQVGGDAQDLFSVIRGGGELTDFPTSELFVTGTVRQIEGAYAEGQVAIQVLIDRFGREGLRKFYKALGSHRIVPGTERYHVRTALQESLHWSYDEWVAAWRKRIG